MSAEMKFEGIPKKFQPLFLGSARKALAIASNMITDASEKDQQVLLEDDIFCHAVSSVLHDLDQRNREARILITSTFHPNIQPLAFKTFIGRSN